MASTKDTLSRRQITLPGKSSPNRCGGKKLVWEKRVGAPAVLNWHVCGALGPCVPPEVVANRLAERGSLVGNNVTVPEGSAQPISEERNAALPNRLSWPSRPRPCSMSLERSRRLYHRRRPATWLQTRYRRNRWAVADESAPQLRARQLLNATFHVVFLLG